MVVLTAALPLALEDAAAALLHHDGASGVEVRDDQLLPPPGVVALPAGRAEVRGYFGDRTSAEAAAARLREELEVDVSLEELPVQDWATDWKKQFRPQRRGRVFVVAPWMGAAEHPTPAGCVRLVLEPGLAFGTGDHQTTGLCLEEVDLYLQSHPAASVLDVGTGSGILAIAARQLGAGPTVATDNDPIALRVALENAEVNRVVLDVRADLPPRATFDLVVANILANTLIDLASQLGAAVAPGGRLVLSGILIDQADEVEAAYRAGLDPKPRRTEDNWVCSVFDKRV